MSFIGSHAFVIQSSVSPGDASSLGGGRRTNLFEEGLVDAAVMNAWAKCAPRADIGLSTRES